MAINVLFYADKSPPTGFSNLVEKRKSVKRVAGWVSSNKQKVTVKNL